MKRQLLVRDTDKNLDKNLQDHTRMLHLRLMVFLCGASLMALEIAGMRLLETHFGGTIYVWGATIGIFLGALSLGYWLGGRLADWKPDTHLLGYIILMAASFSLAIPWMATPLCRWLGATFTDSRLRALLGSTFLYAVPGKTRDSHLLRKN